MHSSLRPSGKNGGSLKTSPQRSPWASRSGDRRHRKSWHGGGLGMFQLLAYLARCDTLSVSERPNSAFFRRIYPSISTPKVEGLALVSRSRTAFQFQHAKRPPARGQRALAVSSFQRGSVLRQLVEQAGLPRPQRPEKIAPDMLRHAAAKQRRNRCGGSS
jgi:hypothetical protein